MPPAYEVLLLNTAIPQIQAAQAGDTYVVPRNIAVNADLSVTGNTILGDASTDTVQVNGYMGVGGAGASTVGINVVSAALTGNTQYGIAATPVGTGTTQINGIAAAAGTSNTAFTVANASGFRALNLAKGAASTITSYHGLYVEDLTQGTNNYGITSLVSSGTNKWNIYASGTAANYFAGNVGIGTSTPSYKLDVVGSASASTPIVRIGASTGPTVGIGSEGTNYAWVQSFGSKPLYINPLGNNTIFNTGGGRVGVNASEPATELEVRGTSPIRASRDSQITGSGTGFGQYAFAARYDASNYIEGASIVAISNGAWSASSIPTYLSFRTGGTTSGSLVERLLLGNAATTFNETGEDIDFRVESDTNTHALFVQGSDGFVGIGTSTPFNELEVYGTGSPRMTIRAPESISETPELGFQFGTEANSSANVLALLRAIPTQVDPSALKADLAFFTNAGDSATERLRITSAGNVSIGGTADRATTVGTNALQIFNGTAPVGTLANGISLYSSSGEAYVMDAAGNATLFSPHDAETNEWIFKSKHTPSGKVLKIDVERLLRFVNDHFGLDAVQEFIEE